MPMMGYRNKRIPKARSLKFFRERPSLFSNLRPLKIKTIIRIVGLSASKTASINMIIRRRALQKVCPFVWKKRMVMIKKLIPAVTRKV